MMDFRGQVRVEIHDQVGRKFGTIQMLPMMMESFQVQYDTMVASVSSDGQNEGNDTETQKSEILDRELGYW